MHHEKAPRVTRRPRETLDVAYRLHPDPFVRKAPTAPALPGAVWINRPEDHRLSPPANLEEHFLQPDPLLPPDEPAVRP